MATKKESRKGALKAMLAKRFGGPKPAGKMPMMPEKK